jgi:hypothetical protein
MVTYVPNSIACKTVIHCYCRGYVDKKKISLVFMAFLKQNLHLYQTLVRSILLQKIGFHRQKTDNLDTLSGQRTVYEL